MYNNYISYLAPCFNRASAFLLPHASGGKKILEPQGHLSPLKNLMRWQVMIGTTSAHHQDHLYCVTNTTCHL